ncbi:PepSY-associated TM helix domain-containing protein [Shewanella algae]|nr:PepSY-associated TM helix domain-containing protein [Shewanella algae]
MMLSNKLRKRIRLLHRDIGYLCIGMTLVYAISGIAVNHINDWNPNYQITQSESRVEGLNPSLGNSDIQSLLSRHFSLQDNIRSGYRASANEYQVFLKDGSQLSANLVSGTVSAEMVNSRPLLQALNYLHLNHARDAWTWIADIYAAMLLFLALSALVMLRSSNLLKSRKTWLTLTGVLLPLLFILLR